MSWNIDQFKSDLNIYISLLNKYSIPIKTKVLSILQSDLESRSIDCADGISHIVRDLELELNQKISGTIPFEVEEFSFFINLNFVLDYGKDFLVQDPFYNDRTSFRGEENIYGYSLEIIINGHSLESTEPYQNSWHLDRHIEGGDTSKVVHPFYHFQNGGHYIEEKPIDTGKIIFTGAPRIPHPPMDIFLSIHFVLKNFFNQNSHDEFGRLYNDPDYETIIENSQNRMWKQYYSAFSRGDHRDYTVDKITPLYNIH